MIGSEINVVVIFQNQHCLYGTGVCRYRYVGSMSVLFNLLLNNSIYILNILAAFWYKYILPSLSTIW